MPEAEDAQLEIKKRARRRLVGAIALSLFAAIVFPLVMDNDPGPMVQDIEIRIPGQDDRTISNRLALQPPPDEAPASTNTASAPQPAAPANEATAVASSKPADVATATVVEKTSEKVSEKPAEKLADKNTEKAPPVATVETKRAQDILNAKAVATPEKSGTHGQFVILIGAFGNEGNVKVLRKKMDEVGVKSFTEPLGEKTRVRAGPFPSRDAAEKALQKMKSIGISGQIASK